ncbi:hypothetical protein O3M35_009228 [Rhynocoris fuscipes]|uniref:Uncharacterized protein n=1 Tax=Rhynocoris fuscipes TaxID=488301 RepID=A0AAW1D236_9HEMI
MFSKSSIAEEDKDEVEKGEGVPELNVKPKRGVLVRSSEEKIHMVGLGGILSSITLSMYQSTVSPAGSHGAKSVSVDEEKEKKKTETEQRD